MKLKDIILEENVLVELKSTTKEGVIREMIERLVHNKKIAPAQKEAAIQEILSRETLGSTGIGNGLAIPHNKKSKAVSTLVGVFAKSSQGIEYGSVDGEMCYLFFLFLSPESSANGEQPHLRILKVLSLLGRDGDFCQFLRNAQTPQEVRDLLDEIDQKMAAST